MTASKSRKSTFPKIAWLRLIIPILLCQTAGVIGSLFTFPSVGTWYATLNKPVFSPPSWVFGPAWLTLYTLMGIAFYLIWQKSKEVEYSNISATVFIIHLIFNTSWSIVFFGMHSIGLALVIIILMWIMILTLIFLFWRSSRIAAYLLIPYILWVTFASILNYSLLILN